MSHVENKVNWCLKKAESEIEQGNMHRGLNKIEPDKKEMGKHILKAEHNLSAIEYFDKGGFSDWSMSAAFYCIYHCFLAIALKFGYESRNLECTIALMKYLKEQENIEIDGRFIKTLEVQEIERHETNVIEKRELYTYGTTISAEEREIEKSIRFCKECLYQTRKIIFESEI